MSYYVDYTGKRFGKLVVVSRGEKNLKRGTYQWNCVCDCGKEKSANMSDLRNGQTTSCGCMSSRNFSGERNKTHNMTKSRQYNIWLMMNARCNNFKNKSFKDYGARGIKVEWETFEEFWNDMGDAYVDNLTIERIDNNKNYCKENCKWIERKEQNLNKRNNKMITFNGETLPTATMARKYGYNPSTVSLRIKNGMSIEQALTKPINNRR